MLTSIYIYVTIDDVIFVKAPECVYVKPKYEMDHPKCIVSNQIEEYISTQSNTCNTSMLLRAI